MPETLPQSAGLKGNDPNLFRKQLRQDRTNPRAPGIVGDFPPTYLSSSINIGDIGHVNTLGPTLVMRLPCISARSSKVILKK